MRTSQFDEILARTLDDRRLSRAEQKVLRKLVAEVDPDERKLRLLQQRAFEVARDHMRDSRNRDVLEWLEDVLKILRPSRDESPSLTEVHLSPGNRPRRRIIDLLESARRQVDICVFTISDNRISDVIERVHRRGIDVRVITDDDKAFDRGSDIDRLHDAGIEVRVDGSPAHMHHKFALFDRSIVLTGSYNWTRSAADSNWENIVVLNDEAVVSQFQVAFEDLWSELG